MMTEIEKRIAQLRAAYDNGILDKDTFDAALRGSHAGMRFLATFLITVLSNGIRSRATSNLLRLPLTTTTRPRPSAPTRRYDGPDRSRATDAMAPLWARLHGFHGRHTCERV